MAQFVGDKCFQPGLRPFVESFQEGYGKRVPECPVLCPVVDGVVDGCAVIEIVLCIEVFRCVVSLVDTAVVVETYGMDETRDRNIFLFHPLLCRLFLCILLPESLHLHGVFKIDGHAVAGLTAVCDCSGLCHVTGYRCVFRTSGRSFFFVVSLFVEFLSVGLCTAAGFLLFLLFFLCFL